MIPITILFRRYPPKAGVYVMQKMAAWDKIKNEDLEEKNEKGERGKEKGRKLHKKGEEG